MHHVDNV